LNLITTADTVTMDVAKLVTGPATVAEFFAMAAGELEPEAPSTVGVYL